MISSIVWYLYPQIFYIRPSLAVFMMGCVVALLEEN